MVRGGRAVVEGVRTVRVVLVSFVLRLRPDQLALGRIVGQIEDVASGHSCGLRDVAELVEFCCGAASLQRIGPVGPDVQGSGK